MSRRVIAPGASFDLFELMADAVRPPTVYPGLPGQHAEHEPTFLDAQVEVLGQQHHPCGGPGAGCSRPPRVCEDCGGITARNWNARLRLP